MKTLTGKMEIRVQMLTQSPDWMSFSIWMKEQLVFSFNVHKHSFMRVISAKRAGKEVDWAYLVDDRGVTFWLTQDLPDMIYQVYMDYKKQKKGTENGGTERKGKPVRKGLL